MSLFGPPLPTKNGNTYIVVITDSYSKLGRAIPSSKMTATHVVYVSLDPRVLPYGIPDHLLMDSGSQFVSKFFAALCGFLGMKHLTRTIEQPQKYGQVEEYNKTIVTRIRIWVAENQYNSDIFVRPLTYAYSNQVYQSKVVTPFSHVLTRHLPGVATSDFPSVVLSDLSCNVSLRILRSHLLARLAFLREKVEKRLAAVRKRYKNDSDRRLLETPVFKTNSLEFVDGPLLLVSTNSSKTNDKPTYKKSTTRDDGPYRIITFQQYTLIIDENGVPNTITIDRAGPAPSDNTKAGIEKEMNATEGEKAIVNNEHQLPEGKAM